MTALRASLAKPVPTVEDVVRVFTAAGVCVTVFQGNLRFNLMRNPDWDTVDAWGMLQRLPGGRDALKRYLKR